MFKKPVTLFESGSCPFIFVGCFILSNYFLKNIKTEIQNISFVFFIPALDYTRISFLTFAKYQI